MGRGDLARLRRPARLHSPGGRPFRVVVRLVAGPVCLLAASLGWSEAAGADATVTVADGDVAGLRAAIRTANANGLDDTIVLAPGGRYTITGPDSTADGSNGLPSILPDSGHSLTINGNGATIVRSVGLAGPTFRLLHVASGATVTTMNLVLRGGSATGGIGNVGASGGAVFNAGTLTMLDCLLTENGAAGRSGTAGGAGGSVGGQGGAGGDARGGAVFSLGRLAMRRVALADNSAIGGPGGNGGTGSSTGGTGGKGGDAEGGAIFSTGDFTTSNITMSANRVAGGRGGDGRESSDVGGSGGDGGAARGGGLAVVPSAGSAATVSLLNVTVSDHRADGGGGGNGANGGTRFGSNGKPGAALGGGLATSAPQVALKNTIVAKNVAVGATPGPDVSGPFKSNGHNLIGVATGSSGFPGNGDLVGTTAAPIDPRLGPLQDNGGQVVTRALLNGSPAIDAGTNNGAPGADARGVHRPQPDGGIVDIGAYELERTAQPGPTFSVNTTADSDDGTCGPRNCSLREAINSANTHPNGTSRRDTVAFAISGDGVHTIRPTSVLPAITDPVVVDGYTELGSRRNQASDRDDAVLVIEIDGTRSGALTGGLSITAADVTVLGLVVNRFPRFGIEVVGPGATRATIEGNFVGTDPTGMTALGNGRTDGAGITVRDSAGNTIGGPDPARRNIVSGNRSANIAITGAAASANAVAGNFIGVDASGRTSTGGNGNGVQISRAPDNSIADNTIAGNSGNGVNIVGGSARNNSLAGNHIGTDAPGTSALGNGTGVAVDGASDTMIGAPAPRGNVISGNLIGVLVTDSASDTAIDGNLIGTAVDGTTALGNASDGIRIEDEATGTKIGGIAGEFPNTIAFNGGTGVAVRSGTGHSIMGNSIFDNGSSGRPGLGIDLGPAGVTVNDPGDADIGPNNLQNAPIIKSVTVVNGHTEVQGTIDGREGVQYHMEFFVSPAADPSGFGEGKTLRARFDLVFSGFNGQPVPFETTIDGPPLAPTDVVAATATTIEADRFAGIETSEFSAAQSPCSLTVTNTKDAGFGSLRDAFGCADRHRSRFGPPDVISFAIPTSDPGYDPAGNGTFTIRPAKALPATVDAVTIDGYTQPGDPATAKPAAKPNAKAVGNDAIIKINLDGRSISGVANGLDILGGGTVRGLAINGFANGVVSHDATIVGNFIGTDPAGTSARGNGTGIRLPARGQRIGGTDPADRNLISGNGVGIVAAGNGNRIEGNYIGTDAGGTNALGNTGNGIFADESGVVIGGATAGAGNVISANGGSGIVLGDSERDLTVLGNAIGTDRSKSKPLPNGLDGIRVGSNNTRIGGTAPGEGNVIAFNRGRGIGATRDGTAGMTFRGNSIHDNGTLGIDLVAAGDPANGVTANDGVDADAGPNGLQNFPRLIAAASDSGGTTVLASLASKPGQAYTIDFYSNASCDPSGNGEGDAFIGSAAVIADGSGAADVTFTTPTVVPVGRALTATATDPQGSTSEFSACTSIVATPVPKAAGGLAASADDAGRVALAWTDNSLFEAGFRIERSDVHGKSHHRDFVTVGVAGRDATSFVDTDVKPHKTYAYRVVAFNRIGDAAASNTVLITTAAEHGHRRV